MDWSEGYVTDVAYVRGYYRELSPLLQSFSLSVAGREAPDLTGSFTKLELGCGYGLSLLMEAAVFPRAQFFGVDFNPEHIAWAKRLAAQANLENVHFFELSFADLMGSPIPNLDFVGLHGVWSWVSDENRHAIVRFLDRRLNSGGVVMNSYNVLPGWSAIQGLRELMMRKYRSVSGSPQARIDEALNFAKACKEAGSALFTAYPGLVGHLEQLFSKPRRYLAHEYFNQDWRLFFQYEVAEMLGAIRLSYAAACRPTENLNQLNLSPSALQIVNSVAQSEQETLKDTFLQRMFRYDIFGRGLELMNAVGANAAILDMTFVLVGDKSKFSDGAFKAPVGVVKYKRDLFEPILSRLEAGPATGRDFLYQPGSRPLAPAQIAEILAVLIDTSIVSPALPVASRLERNSRTQSLNEVLINRMLKGEDVSFLVSPISGFGHGIQNTEQMFILADINGQDPVPYVWRLLQSQGKQMLRDGKPLQSDADNMAELEKARVVFETQSKPIFKRLGIVL